MNITILRQINTLMKSVGINYYFSYTIGTKVVPSIKYKRLELIKSPIDKDSDLHPVTGLRVGEEAILLWEEVTNVSAN